MSLMVKKCDHSILLLTLVKLICNILIFPSIIVKMNFNLSVQLDFTHLNLFHIEK